ncbi:NAD(P)-dependent oxidoreductase [Halomarina litorea]|uniref:NAD(P)-dependent oxidoreductase n=1 Tax=Halomarina litorea TaxID=2961595 RepID=UPI0020C2DF01|nr:NAD(P)H-binding protein [Halomarina sp. BCD28]
MKVTVFGATTATGRAIAEAALDAGHAVTVLAQEPQEFPLDAERLRVLEGDVFDIPTVETAIRGADAVCTAFDEPLDQLPGTDLGDAMENVLDVLSRFQTSRIVVVTAPNGTAEKPGLRARLTNLVGNHERAATEDDQEALVRASTADWTIVRPTGLTDGPATGDYRVEIDEDAESGSLSRADLARFVVDHLDADAYRHQVVTVAG